MTMNLQPPRTTEVKLWKPDKPCRHCYWDWKTGAFKCAPTRGKLSGLVYNPEACSFTLHPDNERWNYADILQSANETQCFSCLMISGAVQGFVPQDLSNIFNLGPALGSDNGITLSLGVMTGQDVKDIKEIEIFTSSKNHVPPYKTLILREPSGDTSSNAALNWAKSWLCHCLRNHMRCSQDQRRIQPTRVIDVTPLNQDGDVRLVDQVKRLLPFDYVALSHCWGPTPINCATTTDNLHEQTERIPFALLSKTFQEAVLFTRNLGVRYIWIDAICIIQKNKDDWLREASQMSDVYGNSIVTLAAVHAKDGSGGLFSQISKEYESHTLPPINILGENWQFFARKKLPLFHTWARTHLGERGTEDAPLFERAWAYQERIMSPRVLFFSKEELLFECCEDQGRESVAEAPMASQPVAKDERISPKIRHTALLDAGEVISRWREIVGEYSNLKLTVETDKLLGISAVARQMKRYRPKAQYLAGLWSDNLVEDLLWSTNDDATDERGNGDFRRPKTWCAPSWSWASVSNQVHYPASIWSKNPGTKGTYYPKVTGVYCKTVQDDEFGLVEWGYCCIQSQMTECTLDLSGDRPTLSHPKAPNGFKWRQFSLDVSIYNQPQNQRLQHGDKLLLLRGYEGVCSHHLVLRWAPPPETGVRERVGMFTLISENQFHLSEAIFSDAKLEGLSIV